MTARSGMASLILELRGMTSAGTADYTVAGAAYWTDDQLQAILDKHRTEVVSDQLVHINEYQGGALSVTRYYSHFGNFEQTTGGTAIFVLQDGTHNAVASSEYAVDYTRGEITFDAPTGGLPYYLTGRSYDLNRAAADVWTQKAGQVAIASFSWSTDNMRVDKSGLRKEAVDMAQYYRGLAGPTSIDLNRSDTDA